MVLSWYEHRPHKCDAVGIRLWTQQMDQIEKYRELAAYSGTHKG